MKDLTMLDLFKQIEGSIYPIAETNYDSKCLKNIENWIEMIDALINELYRVANMNEEDRSYASVRNVSDKARSFLKCLLDDLNEDIKEWD